MAFFFFSSRRRHTRSKRDWSSDVCSSDLSPTTSSAGRGRPRAEGLAGEGDDLSPGADPELPAVMLRSDAPPAEPLVLRLPAAALPAPVLRLVESGEYLVHAVRLPAPFALRLAARLESDEDLRVALAPADYTRWRDVLARALAAAGVPVD